MLGRLFRVDLPETREPCAGLPFLKETKEGAAPFDIIFKRELSTRQKADRYRLRIDGCEAAGGSAWKGCRYQVVAGFGRSRLDGMKTVVTHGGLFRMLITPAAIP
jgi:hypothetical protein